MNKHRTISVPTLKNALIIILGTVILSFGVALFLIPFELVSGGAMGISIIVAHLFPLEIVTADLVLVILSWLLFILGAVTLGKGFAAKTFLSTLVYSPLVALFSRLVTSDILNGYFILSEGEYGEISIILACIFGGALVGIGISLTFLGGGSTGGTDVIALILAKRIKRLKSSVAVFAVDAAIVLFGIFAIADLTKSLLGILTALICAFTVDRLLEVFTRFLKK